MSDDTARTAGVSPPVQDRTTQQACSAGGWEISSKKAPISGQVSMQEISDRLGGPANLPEMTYGENVLLLKHEASGTQLKFTAESALKEWLEEGQAPLQLSTADKWKEARQLEIKLSNATMLEYDWTYTTPYRGTATDKQNQDIDEKFEDSMEQIDREMLMTRDPITFFDDVTLYESEMDDNGVCRCSVRVRVMPECWFVLLRFWLRVDDTMVRLRDCRYFTKFEWGGKVLREIRYAEGTYSDLLEAGAPASNVAYADAESADMALQAVAPVAVTVFKTQVLQLE